MCRSIKKLRNSEPAPAEDIEAAALQFVRKISGQRTPTKKSEEAFNEAVALVTRATADLLEKMGTTPSNPNALPALPPRTRAQRERDRRTEVDFNSSYTARELAERQGVGPFDMKLIGILRDVSDEEHEQFLADLRESRKELPRDLGE